MEQRRWICPNDCDRKLQVPLALDTRRPGVILRGAKADHHLMQGEARQFRHLRSVSSRNQCRNIHNDDLLRMDRTLAHLQRIVLPDPTAPINSTHAFNLPLIDSLLGIQQPASRPDIPPVLSKKAETNTGTQASGDIEWFGANLNDSQKEAIQFCLKAEHIACIHGPPGVCCSK